MRKLTPHFLKSPYKDRSLSIWSQITTNWIGDLHSIKHRWISITLQVFIAPHPLTILLPRISLTQIPVCICHQLNPLMSNREINSGTPTNPITAAWMQNHRREFMYKKCWIGSKFFQTRCNLWLNRVQDIRFCDFEHWVGKFSYQKLRNASL